MARALTHSHKFGGLTLTLQISEMPKRQSRTSDGEARECSLHPLPQGNHSKGLGAANLVLDRMHVLVYTNLRCPRLPQALHDFLDLVDGLAGGQILRGGRGHGQTEGLHNRTIKHTRDATLSLDARKVRQGTSDIGVPVDGGAGDHAPIQAELLQSVFRPKLNKGSGLLRVHVSSWGELLHREQVAFDLELFGQVENSHA